MAKNTDDMITTACNLCFVNCGLKIKVGGENNRDIIKVMGDKDHPMSKGYICNKAARINFYQNSDARLKSPMRRKADGSYEQIDWDTAISEIAEKLGNIRDTHGGERIFYYGGGAQGDHLGGAYAQALRSALGIRYKGNAISQEKTGLAWVMSRMVGGPVHSAVHYAKVAMFVGKNPFMSNGMHEARPFLRAIAKDEGRKLIVVDPRRTETADYADIHLAVKPGRDAWCMAAIVAYMVQNNLLPLDWIARHTEGFEQVSSAFGAIHIDAFADFCGIPASQIAEVAELIAGAESFALEEDIGIQMAPHSTLVTYLNFLTSILTGNFGKPGGMDVTTSLAEVVPSDRTPVDEKDYNVGRKTLPVTGAPIVSGLYPGAFLAEEILNDDPQRPRAIFIESSNPVHSLPESQKLRNAIRSLDCSVSIDIAMTETAMVCDYVLPAASNYEKYSATFFPNNYPANIFHLRPPVFTPEENTLPEAEIHARIIDALQPFSSDELSLLAEAGKKGIDTYKQVFFEQMMANPKITKMISYVLYKTLGPALGEDKKAASAIWGLCQMYIMKHPKAAARAGFEGENAGTDLFTAILDRPEGAIIGVSEHKESFDRLAHPDKKLRLVIAELLDELAVLSDLKPLLDTSEQYPFSLVAGARRAYTANCAIRDPRWIKGKQAFALTIHPDDATRLSLNDGDTVVLETEAGKTNATLALDDRMHLGTLSIPNGQGMSFTDKEGNDFEVGVFANELTSVKYRDKFMGTPFHKFVPARVSLMAS